MFYIREHEYCLKSGYHKCSRNYLRVLLKQISRKRFYRDQIAGLQARFNYN